MAILRASIATPATKKSKPPKLTFDAENNIVLPKEHEDLVMGHGRHQRNSNCFNCHDETNLALLQTRDGHKVKITDSPERCTPDDAPSTLIIC
ncbi:MAG: hypothetical protein HY298_06130 [Verrucomicrobia bacterium]|nr:hypothetical protein [Verrucomicrobiota bacterium]